MLVSLAWHEHWEALEEQVGDFCLLWMVVPTSYSLYPELEYLSLFFLVYMLS